jgi:hypothetical protein
MIDNTLRHIDKSLSENLTFSYGCPINMVHGAMGNGNPTLNGKK